MALLFQPSVSPFAGQPHLSRSRLRPVRSAAERQVLFDRIAPVYDNLNDVLSLGQHRIWKRMAVNWSGAKEGDKVLDLCCGSGDLAFLLSEKVGPNGKARPIMLPFQTPSPLGEIVPMELKLLGNLVFGLDFSKEQLMVASSRQHLRSKACYNNLMWVEGDAVDLPFSDSYFDGITIGYGLRNVLDKHMAMKEMHRVLKPGSKVSVLDFNKSTGPSALMQDWIIDNVVVPVATSYGLEEEYRYLKKSIQEFLTGKELEKLALEVGFSSSKHFEVGGGLMGNLVATR